MAVLCIASLILFAPPATAVDTWFNSTWHFKQTFQFNASGYSRTNWPIELQMNFTDLLFRASSGNLSFDVTSIRVFEYNSTGGLMQQVPYQFDLDNSYDQNTNAVGELVFLMNGTTPAYSSRKFIIYFDTLGNGQKPSITFTPLLNYTWDGKEFNVNNSEFQWYVDTNRLDNTSGIYRVVGFRGVGEIFNALPDERTIEYGEYANGTNSLGFNLIGNVTFVAGPVRITAILQGNEIPWGNPSSPTNEATIVKKYRFYANSTRLRVDQNLTNTAPYNLTRYSASAGAVAIDALRALGGGYLSQQNNTEPYSWVYGSEAFNSWALGIVNSLQNGTANYVAIADDAAGRIGVNLSTTAIPASNSISDSAYLLFNDIPGSTTFFDSIKNLSLGFYDYLRPNVSNSEQWSVNFTVRANHTVYNRNETAVILLNVTSDTYNFTSSVNVTLDNGTASPSDDFNLTLYDDGLHNDFAAGDGVFGNNFTLAPDANLGAWNISGRAYGGNMLLLSSNSSTFNVTGLYALNISISNDFGITNRTVNGTVTVMNYRQDAYHGAAAIACTYPLVSTTDFGNGTYAISFLAPSNPGNFTVICNATKAGNFGNNSAAFSSEAARTNASITNSPTYVLATNITQTGNFTFLLAVNATNLGSGAAYLSNFTLSIPANWTASSLSYVCGNLSVGSYCNATFQITVANKTLSGNYSINASFNWLNPDFTGASNVSTTIVEVQPNPILTVPPVQLYAIVGVGKTIRIGNFSVFSDGNDPLTGVNFTVIGLPSLNFTFIPPNLASLNGGSQYSVQMNVSVPNGHPPGDYGGAVQITATNAGNATILFNLTISGANVSISINPQLFVAGNITQTQSQSFIFEVNLTNTGNVTSYYANISLSLPAGIAANSSLVSCGNVTVGSNCSAGFLITVLNASTPGTYLVNASAVWEDIGSGIQYNTSILNITVLSNPVMQILQNVVSGNATHGNTTTIANFTIYSSGNDALHNVSINLTSGLPNFTITFMPQSFASMAAGSSQSVSVNVTVPYLYDPVEENGTADVTTQNAGNSSLVLQVFVAYDRSWTMSRTYCEKTESPNIGTACEIQVNNTGNSPINFTITPTAANFTSANTLNFTIPKQGTYSFNVTYNITGQPKIPYNTTYRINATSAYSSPQSRTFVIALVPFQSLRATASISPLVIQNNQSVQMEFNVTDANLVGIQNAIAIVTLPNGTLTNVSLQLAENIFNATGNLTVWRGAYPNATGSTALKGNYSVQFVALDNVDVNGTSNGTFYAYPLLNPVLQTLSSSYPAGGSATIYYRARDLGGTPLEGSAVTIWVRDPLSILVYNNTFVTAASGIIEPLPSFSIAPDATLGNWTLYSYATYADPDASITVNNSHSSTFQVVAPSSGNVSFSGLLTDFKTSDLFFGGDTIQLAISVYDVNGAPLDPDFMNITIYSPNESVYSAVNFSQINRSSIGLYYYKFVAPRNATSGVYRAELNTFRGAYFNRNLALFRVSSSLFADIETSFVWYPNSVMTFRAIVYTGDGMPIDPTSLNLTVIDPAGNIYFSIPLSSMTRQSAGYYLYNHAMGANTSTGNYYAQLIATRDTATTVKLKPFRVSQGGPYDVRLELLQYRVYPGDYLDFRAVAENKGEVTQDVTLEYWVSDQLQTWYYGSEAILTPAYQNTTVLRSAYIFTSQPPGLYTLHGRVTYDLIKPPIDVNYTFEVVSRPAATPTPGATYQPPSGGGTVTPLPPGSTPTPTPPIYRDYSGMQIVSYPDEVSVMAGEVKYPKIQVKNTGLVPLHNVTVTLAGIPLSWIEVLPGRVNALAPGDVATFVIKISIPATEKTSVRKVRALALSSERKEEARFDVSIFESKLALIEHQIQRLKDGVGQLAKDTKSAEEAGKNVAPIWETIDDVQKYLAQAEDQLRNEQLDDALGSVQIADTLLSKGKAQLVAAPFNPPAYAQVPNWAPLALGFVGTGMGILVFWFVRRKKKEQPAKQKEPPGVIEKVTEVFEKADQVSMVKEKNKIVRAMKLLEDELHDGTISQNAYAELKRRYDRKLAGLETKLTK